MNGELKFDVNYFHTDTLIKMPQGNEKIGKATTCVIFNEN